MKKINLENRYNLIDAIRGVMLVNMIVFHFLYDVFMIYGVDSKWAFVPAVVVWERIISVTFLVVSGISLNFSKHAYRRGIIVNLCGFLITVVTFFAVPSQPVWFGVLNFIGCAMMICNALKNYLNKLDPVLGAGLSLLCFAVFYCVPERYLGLFGLKLIKLPDFLYGFRYAAFLGFPDKDFFSADFFPIIPHIFIFVFGYYLWRIIKSANKEELFRRRVYVLDFMGRHSLIIYLLHQPVLIGICFLIFGHI